MTGPIDPSMPIRKLGVEGPLADVQPDKELRPPLSGFATSDQPGVSGRASGPIAQPGVYGFGGPGVMGETSDSGTAGTLGVSHSSASAGVLGRNDHGGPAGAFEGDVTVSGNVIVGGDVRFTNAGDYAEEFEVADGHAVEPGTVMVLTADGRLKVSQRAYDTRVAGVVSGAGQLRPAVILDHRAAQGGRAPLALMGTVYCRVIASGSPVSAGDLLTTSATPGHAMKAADRRLAVGAILGKALQPLDSGSGLLPILVALQ